jgi:glycosyltransferase involved in cell wall biosynthesis
MAPKVLTLIGDQKTGCEMWRTFQPMAELQRQGYPLIEWGERADPRLANYAHLFEAIVLQRLSWKDSEVFKQRQWFEALHNAGKCVIYEVDDDIFSDGFVNRLITLHKFSEEESEERRRCNLRAMQACDGVTVSTQRLASIVRQYTDKPVKVVGNYIDLSWFKKVTKAAQRDPKLTGLTIGWAGGQRPDADVYHMSEAWRRIAEKYPHVTFVVQGHHAKPIYAAVPHERIAMIDWMPLETYPAGLINIDIGCCPLADFPFNRAKTHIKAMEYAAIGAPVVASPTVYNKLIQHEYDGYIVETADEWEQALSRLVEDYPHRKQMAGRLRYKVRKEHGLERNVWRWLVAWQEIIDDCKWRQRYRILLPSEVNYVGV